MATYTPQSLKINASTTGGQFKTGAWYSGRQYWNGTLSEPGQIHPESDQVGAGKDVSKEVVQQTAPQNWEYIQNEKAKAAASPTTPAQLYSTLDKFQNQTFQGANATALGVATIDEMKSKLSPTTPAPAPLNRVEEYGKLTEQFKVTDLETTLNDLKAQEDEAVAALRIQTQTERGKPVAQGVIEGRVSEETRIAQENLDFIQRQKTRVVDELNTKYNVINTYMNLMGLDYNDAVSRYDSEYAKNIQIYGIIQQQQETAFNQSQAIQNSARANLQIYVNAITAGNIDVNSLSGDQKLMLNKLEVQSGLPIGFISSIKKDPKADIIFTNSNNGVTQVGMRNADGTISVQNYGTPNGGTGTQYQQEKQAISDMTARLSGAAGKNGKVSASTWSQMRVLWLRAGFSGKTFDETYRSQFVDENKPWDYGFND